MIYEVRTSKNNEEGKWSGWGGSYDLASAEIELDRVKEAVGKYWDNLWIEEIDDTDLPKIPSQPAPRDRFIATVKETSKPGAWHEVHVLIIDSENNEVVYEYDRNYSFLRSFEPFRQGDKNFALISSHYTATQVVDLDEGKIIAEEPVASAGFCPVGFYVPDYWDLHDGSVLPGTKYWDPNDEGAPLGQYGFVWGCVWGDDWSWKVQYLDLSNIQAGELKREKRFGYISLHTTADGPASDFIRVSNETQSVTFAVETTFNLATGKQSKY